MKKRLLHIIFAILLAITIVGVVFWDKEKDIQARIVTPDMFEVIDGDTVYFNGKIARLLGFDTAELAFFEKGTGLPTPFIGDQEPWASEGRDKLQQLINSSNKLEVAFAEQDDKYNRKLIHIYSNDVPVGVLMIEAGLAYQTVTRYGDNGFPEEAEMILKATSQSEKPKFTNPHVWRRTHSNNARSD